MTDVETIAILKKAIKQYGNESQRRMAIEEMSELTKALCKWERGFYNLDEIAEELADVFIMLQQLILIFDVGESFDYWYETKLLRLNKNLDR